MAMKLITVLCSILAIWAVQNVDSASPPHAPTPAVDCSTLVMNMADCLSFVTNGSTVRKPEGTCCSGLKTVLKANADCLCEAFKSSAQLGVTLNVTKAMTLPSACHASAPSFSNCALSAAPGAAPAASPTIAPAPSSVAGAPTSTAGSAELAPAPTPGISGSSALSISLRALLATIVVAASMHCSF